MSSTESGLTHPSFLALDRASLGVVNADVQAHLVTCPVCNDYVASLKIPASSSRLAPLREGVQRAGRLRKLLWWSGAPVAAAAGALLFVNLRSTQPSLDRTQYVASKGFPSVWIYVKHGPNTELWNEKKPVFAGDRLRLKVDPGPFHRVAVFSVKEPGAPELLSSGEVVPERSVTLPDAWEVDAEPGNERLVIVLSDEALTEIPPNWLRGESPANIRMMSFSLPKSPKDGATAP